MPIFKSLNMRSAIATNSRPAAVVVTCREVRRNSGTPRVCSSRLMLSVSAGCEIPRCAARRRSFDISPRSLRDGCSH
jgi:hypothetical protein